LQQLLQQVAHLPSVHLAHELQLVLQHFEQALSAAVAVASPKPAMMASMAPALINVFMVLFLLFVLVAGEGVIPSPLFHEVITHRGENPPVFFQKSAGRPADTLNLLAGKGLWISNPLPRPRD
jgi:hypothetical protein